MFHLRILIYFCVLFLSKTLGSEEDNANPLESLCGSEIEIIEIDVPVETSNDDEKKDDEQNSEDVSWDCSDVSLGLHRCVQRSKAPVFAKAEPSSAPMPAKPPRGAFYQKPDAKVAGSLLDWLETLAKLIKDVEDISLD